MEIQIENLKAQMRGVELNIHQRADALIEFNKLVEYTENLESKVENLGIHGVVFSDTECKHKDSCGHDLCNLTECDEFEKKLSGAEVRCETCKHADGWKCNHPQGCEINGDYELWEQST